jgi:ribosomal protein L11 methyltransferase
MATLFSCRFLSGKYPAKVLTMSDYIKISVGPREQAFKDVLLALLSDAGYDGFEEERTILHAYIKTDEFDENILKDILSPFADTYQRTAIAETNWNEEWEKSFDPVVVGNFCAVRAAFHEPGNAVTHDIIITPRMSFGTGHHATTYMMLDAMQNISFEDKTVLDFGTGTGVLAILAEKLGAAGIVAIDNDDWSIENARENISVNGCGRVVLNKAEQLEMKDQFDIILANINKNVILTQLASIKQHLSGGGVVLLSGLLWADQDDMLKAASVNQLEIVEQKEKDGWILIRLSLL